MRTNKSCESDNTEKVRGFLKSGKAFEWISNIQKTAKAKYRRKIRTEMRECPVCRSNSFVNFIVSISRWYCTRCDTEFDRNNVIYVYDEDGNLVEVISSNPGILEKLNFGKLEKRLIKTITV